MGHRFEQAVRKLARQSRCASLLPIRLALPAYGGTDKSRHGFGRYYDWELTRFRLRRFVFLEIGVRNGDSIRVWRDSFPRSTVVGLDINHVELQLGRRVRIRRGDQRLPEAIESALEGLPMPHVVVDDGSHRGSDQWATFEHLFPRLPSGAVYVLEDLSTSYWEDFGGSVPAPEISGVGIVRGAVDSAQVSAPVYRWAEYQDRPRPAARLSGVASVHAYPNIAFIVRA